MNSGTNSLEDLARVGQIFTMSASAEEISRLLNCAEDYLCDCRDTTLSTLSKSVLAYGAAHRLALVALRAEGYCPVSSDGHSEVIFKTLETTASAPRELWLSLDRYHDRRNAAEYEAAPPASEAEAKNLVTLTGKLQKLVLDRIKRSHPELLKK